MEALRGGFSVWRRLPPGPACAPSSPWCPVPPPPHHCTPEPMPRVRTGTTRTRTTQSQWRSHRSASILCSHQQFGFIGLDQNRECLIKCHFPFFKQTESHEHKITKTQGRKVLHHFPLLIIETQKIFLHLLRISLHQTDEDVFLFSCFQNIVVLYHKMKLQCEIRIG